MGSQAPEVMAAPICSLTVGSEFRYETTVAGIEALLEMLCTGTSNAEFAVVGTPSRISVLVAQAVETGSRYRCEKVS